MKKVLIFTLCLSFLVSMAFAQEMIPTIDKVANNVPMGKPHITNDRMSPNFTFTHAPSAIMTSYYDYMIGSYNGIPLRVIPPDIQGGGYFMTYHGRRTASGTRRVFYTYLNSSGNTIANSEITNTANNEGYPTVAVDPVSGKPLYAWHANADTDTQLETQFTADGFIDGSYGIFGDIITLMDNPAVINTSPTESTSDNEFIWPTAQIGPSPVAGKRRVYVVSRNSVTHSYGPSENPRFAYADFDANQIEGGVPLDWNYMTIPEMDQWNVDDQWRRPFHALTTDDAGNLYYAGFHFATEADGTTDISEPDIDVFKCGNYGEGTWSRVSEWSRISTWNPNSSPTDTTGFFASDATGLPYGDNEIYFQIMGAGSSHLNASVDDLNRIHFPAIWGLNNYEGYYYPYYQYPKEVIFDPTLPEDSQFKINELWPQKDVTNTYSDFYQPWDNEAPWGEEEFVQDPDTGTWTPDSVNSWDFPYWDQSAHSDAMFFHCNNMKVTEGNGHGMLATVWQNCYRAVLANALGDPDYSAWANTPEIWISVSQDNGNHWSSPIKLNNIETPEFAGLKPMWVYPADKVIWVSDGENGRKVGKLGLMFYNDYTWGAYAIDPPVGSTNDGGQVMFTELEITFPLPGEASDDPTVTPVTNMLNQNYPNPFNPVTTITFDMAKKAVANVSVYNVKGQLVKTLYNGIADFGRNSVTWNGIDNNGSQVSSGLYFYRLSTDGKVETRKMMLMK
ncbi:MAG: T9SS type A sorting domain-containing protein [Candidatus Cloacimonas sp.]